MITRNELVALINLTFDAVNQSKAGPIILENESGEKVLMPLGYNTFLYAVQKIVPMVADFSITEHKMDGEEEQAKVTT